MLLTLLRTDIAQRYAARHIVHIKCVLQEWGLKLWFGFNWLRIESSGGHSWSR
jgi:hypothetical protein